MLVRHRTDRFMLLQRDEPLALTFRRLSDGASVELVGPAADAEAMRAIEEYTDARSRDFLFNDMAQTFALAMKPPAR